jgi:drug/metabolite transporter (DMT)-like permease
VRPIHVLQLLSLAVIGGFGFIFMRIAAPFMSAVWLVELRLLIALPILLLVLRLKGLKLQLREHWRCYAVLGVLNVAAPFAISSWAAKSLFASLLGIINATAPLFGTVIGLLWLRTRPSLVQVSGVLAGLAGVTILMSDGSADALSANHMFIVLVALLAPICFGVGATYANVAQAMAGPMQIAAGSTLLAACMLLPMLPFTQPPENLPTAALVSVVCAGLFNTATNFLLFYSLVQSVGATPALAINYLTPITGIVFAILLLGEPLPPSFVSGGLLALLGTVFATNTHRLLLGVLRRSAPAA